MSNRTMVPAFLQKIDERLLKNNPVRWSTRAHLVLWFVFLFALATGALCYLFFFNPKLPNQIEVWVTLLVLASFIGFVIWIIFLLRFNVFKRFGDYPPVSWLKTFALYFLCVGALVFLPFIPSIVQTVRANQKYSTEELANDINSANLAITRLESESLPKAWIRDTIFVSKTRLQEEVDYSISAADTVAVLRVSKYQIWDTAEFSTRLAAQDSVIKIHDSLYIFLEPREYQFLNPYYIAPPLLDKVLSSTQLYNLVLRNGHSIDPNQSLSVIRNLQKKYSTPIPSYGQERDVAKSTYYDKLIQKYKLADVSDAMTNISRKKFEWNLRYDDYARLFFYTTLILTLLVFIFRHTTTKVFFWSLLTATVISILTGFFIALVRGDESTLLSMLIIYFIVFLFIGLAAFQSPIRSTLQGIGMNLAIFLSPFIPLTGLELYYTIQRKYSDTHNYLVIVRDTSVILMCEAGGFILFLILIHYLFRKMYTKWYASPEA